MEEEETVKGRGREGGSEGGRRDSNKYCTSALRRSELKRRNIIC